MSISLQSQRHAACHIWFDHLMSDPKVVVPPVVLKQLLTPIERKKYQSHLTFLRTDHATLGKPFGDIYGAAARYWRKAQIMQAIIARASISQAPAAAMRKVGTIAARLLKEYQSMNFQDKCLFRWPLGQHTPKLSAQQPYYGLPVPIRNRDVYGVLDSLHNAAQIAVLAHILGVNHISQQPGLISSTRLGSMPTWAGKPSAFDVLWKLRAFARMRLR